jgi:DNA-binding IclR family transcriptional regulator
VGHASSAEHSGIGVIDKAAAILSAVADRPLSLAELVEATAMPRATAHRLAMALYAHRLLDRDVDGRFLPGRRLAELAAAVPDPLVLAAAPVLAWVRDEVGESAQLYRIDGNERLCIAVAERATGLRTTVPIGTRLPLTAGSGAQVLCAWRTDADLAQLLQTAQFTTRTLAEVRRRGWAQSVAQREAGVASVSAPVHTEGGPVIAALSISGPIERLGRTPGLRAGPILVAGARRISAALPTPKN